MEKALWPPGVHIQETTSYPCPFHHDQLEHHSIPITLTIYLDYPSSSDANMSPSLGAYAARINQNAREVLML